MSPCVHPKTLLTQYIEMCTSDMHQTYTSDAIWTRSTQRAQTSAERQHNRIAEWFLQCKLAMQLWSESTRYFFDNPVNPDFGRRTPGSGRWSGSSQKFNHLVPGPCPTRPTNFVKIRSQLFQLSDRQTDRQTNRPKWKPPSSAAEVNRDERFILE